MSEVKKSTLRPAFVWLYRKRKSYKDIAAIFGVNPHMVNRKPHKSVESLKTAMKSDWEALNEGTLRRVVDDFPRRLDVCIETEGKNFKSSSVGSLNTHNKHCFS